MVLIMPYMKLDIMSCLQSDIIFTNLFINVTVGIFYKWYNLIWSLTILFHIRNSTLLRCLRPMRTGI